MSASREPAEGTGDIRLRRLKTRPEFLRAARGRRASRRGLGLQMIQSDHERPGIGFTVTKRTGNAVVRNRIKRRLREAVRQKAACFHARHDYVLIGRPEALTEPFAALGQSIEALVAAVHANRKPARP